MKKKDNKWILTIGILLLIAGATGVFFRQTVQSSTQENRVFAKEDHIKRDILVEGKNYQERVNIAAIGDILIHDTVFLDAATAEGYDFKPMFSHVKDTLTKPDILLANQETILGGMELGLSGYPTFNSPREVGDALIDAGVDIVSTANNHTLDKGEKGIQSSMGYLSEVGLPYVGSFKNPEDQQRLRILNHDGVNIAYLSYTYGTNGIPVPEGKDFLVNLIDKAAMKEEIHRAKDQADVVVMSIHWGNEYQRTPDNIQQELAHFIVNEGVDVVFGHHPHVLQPMEWIQTDDGRKAFVIYSLGNFLSGQMWDYKDIGGMVSLDIIKKITSDGTTIELANPEFSPTYVSSSGQRNYQVVPLEQAGKYGLEQAKSKYEEIMSHMTEPLKTN
ncbi:CapA family protein [Mesobacillus maritimus]|uniref:CapA family protein n=1 Tax=Mesobacillus maritimus TaxID=1643336 RepID=A0ABS7K1M5_9BACI|nr:CapA family protein [Mesobacillus maritimus]MBY0096089.1 CapA family protein [Mesobacillus maritimus]